MKKMGRRETPQTQNRMNKKLTSLSALRSLTTLIVFLATGYAYLVPLANVLRYHEQHHLFRFTGDYFRQTLAEEGLLRYATNFVVQFFFHPWLGAMVMATLLTLIFVGVEGMLKRLLFGRALPLCLGLVPVLWLLFYTETTAHDLCWVVLSVVGGGIALAIHFVATPVPCSKALVNEGTSHQSATCGDDGIGRGLCGLREALSG